MKATCRALGAVLLSTIQVHAGILFYYGGFAATGGLTLVGNAGTAVTTDGTVLRVAPASGNQSGAVYSSTPVALGPGNTFSTQFHFRFTNPDGYDPADGLTFVLATNTTGLGALGGGMGYQGVAGNSVAIEFDTFNNGGSGLGTDDNSSNHVAIDINGALTNTALANVYDNQSCGFPVTGIPPQDNYLVPGCMSNGDLWTVNIVYDGANLTVILSDPAVGTSFTAINEYPIDLAATLGQTTAYVGFTAGTGAGWENHDIIDWTFSTSTSASGAPCDVNQDGTINVADVQRIINEALGVVPAVDDENGDTVVNVSDVQIVINAALGLGCVR